MTRAPSSPSQYSSRSLLETSARLPTLTQLETPRPTRPATAMAAIPSAPLSDDMATPPRGGNDGTKTA